MKASSAYANLRQFGRLLFSTEDVAIRLRLSSSGASKLMSRLKQDGLARQVRHGLWTLDSKIERFALPEHLTVPHPAYVSLQTALYLHGLISQIPHVIYVVSTAPTQTIKTEVGTYSIHQVIPEFFGGYSEEKGFKVATPEKALVDFLYLSNTRSRLFACLPEVELPKQFNVRAAWQWVARIQSGLHRTMVTQRLQRILAENGREARPVTSPRRGAMADFHAAMSRHTSAPSAPVPRAAPSGTKPRGKRTPAKLAEPVA